MTNLAKIVNPLEWVKHSSRAIWRADTSLGAYKVFGVGQKPSWDFDARDAQHSSVCDDVSEAFAAAKADYTRRILAAIDTDTLRDLFEDMVRAGLEMGAKKSGEFVGADLIAKAIRATDQAAIAEAVTKVLGEEKP